MGQCNVAHDSTLLIQMIVASLLASVAFRLGNQGVLIGSMLISPIGGMVLRVAMGDTNSARGLVHMWIPFAIGFLSGMTTLDEPPNNLLENSGIHVMQNPQSLLDSLVVSTMCGVLFPVLKQIPEVGIDIATQILPPLVACGVSVARAVMGKESWYSACGCLILFVTYITGLFVSTKVTTALICNHTGK